MNELFSGMIVVMGLPNDYSGQVCSMSRTLEIVGERWTLLLIRDAFFGVRRFGDFVARLGIPRAVLTDRLATLVGTGVMSREGADGKRAEYVLTSKGRALWPILRALTAWGDHYCAPHGPLRLFRHVADNGLLDADGVCETCCCIVDVADTMMEPGPGLVPHPDQSTSTIRLLDPVRG